MDQKNVQFLLDQIAVACMEITHVYPRGYIQASGLQFYLTMDQLATNWAIYRLEA